MRSLFKKKRNQRFVTSSIIIVNVIGAILLAQVFYPTASKFTSEYSREQIIEKLLDRESVAIDKNLPHYQYALIQDSIKRKIYEENINTGSSGSGWFFSNFGVASMDTENNLAYYLNIPGYYQNTHYISFYNTQAENVIDYIDVSNGKFKYEKTKLNLFKPEKDGREWVIGFPLNKQSYKVWQFILAFIGIGFIVIGYYCLIMIPYKLLILLARGEAFNNETIGSLYTISSFLIFSGLFLSLVKIVAHTWLNQQIPNALTFYVYDDIMSSAGFIIAGLIVLLFAKAFQKGYQLQEEQELTV